MARRIAVSTLNASTLDIINTIRANANAEYQSLVPEITRETDIPKVGEVLYGYPALANQFLSALINRIASVQIKSATFNNAYAMLKKGYLEFGETVEEVFVNICKAREFSAEKAESREFKRTIPDVRSAFHTMNYRVQYPITIQQEDLRMAFLSASGVQDLVAKIVNAVNTSAEYDEFLLFKYLLIKAISHGKMHPIGIDNTDIKNAGVAFRAASNKLGFMNTIYNVSGVHTTTPKSDQYIFLDTDFDAQYDVNVLASAFNMDKVEFIGHRLLIDDWTTFDSDRFSIIVENSDMIEPITEQELSLMAGVTGVLVDKEWFQVWDNNNIMTETPVASGIYWNYFYNVWKTVSWSPFSNAIVFVDNTASTALPNTITVTVASKDVSDEATVFTLLASEPTGFAPTELRFVQTEDMTESAVAMHPYGAMVIPEEPVGSATTWELVAQLSGATYNSGTTKIGATTAVGATITLTKV